MGLTRRELLAALAAMPLAACLPGRRGRPLSGRLVGVDAARAHSLRAPPPSPPEVSEHRDVVIVGGGIAGLSAGWTLDRAELRDWTCLELDDVPGGTSRSGACAITRHPWGAHYVPVPVVPNPALELLLEEVGAFERRDASGRPVWSEEALCADPEERIYQAGTWLEGLYPAIGATRDDLAQLARFEEEMRAWSRRRDALGRPAFAVPRALGSDAPEVRELDRISMARWLDERGFTSPRLRWLVEYGCRDDFGGTLEQVSAWAGVHYHASRLQEDGEPAPVLTWPEGNGRLVDHLAARAGDRLRTGAIALDVEPSPDHVDVTWRRGSDVARIRAGHVVLALPRHVVRHVLRPWREAPPAFLASTVYGSWLVANVQVSEPPRGPGFPLAWDNVLHDSPSLGYVVATHQSRRSGLAEDAGGTVLTWYHAYLDDDVKARRETLLRSRWEDLAEMALRDLERAHPGLRSTVESVDVLPWGHAMVRPRPGWCFGEDLAACSRPLGRVRFAHCDLSGMALIEEAQRAAVVAAEGILAELGRPFASLL